MVKVSALFFILAAIAFTNAAVIPRDDKSDKSGITVAVESEELFCTFLPRVPGQEIGASEDDAISFCTQETPDAPGAKIFPDGFILSNHFATKDNYVQITGRMDGSAYNLSSSDGGGQYDSEGSPPGALCTGYKKFVNLIEPDVGLYCIRCCEDPDDCDTGRSTDGCESVIPGDYS